MTLTITISPETQSILEQQAIAAGRDVPSYVLEAIHEKIAQRDESSADRRSYEEWSKEFQAWLATHQSRNPDFDDSRDSIYD